MSKGNVVPIGLWNSFGMYDKAMGIVIDILGEDITEPYKVSVVKRECKIMLPLSVPLEKLQGRDDVTITFTETTSNIFVH